jgi:hypothetical protein
MSDGSNWTRGPKKLALLSELHEALARVHRIELLAKLARAKKQLEMAQLIEEKANHGAR